MKNETIHRAFGAILVSFGFCLPVNAGLVFDNSGLAGNQYNGPFILGLDFTVVTAGYVNAVGLFDAGGDGFGTERLKVAIFNLNGSKVSGTEYTFTGNSDPLSNGSRIHSISQVSLPVGSYSIVAASLGSSLNPLWNLVYPHSSLKPTFDGQGGALSFSGNARWNWGSISGGISLPTTTGNFESPAFAAGTFDFSTTAVPEPSTYLAGLGALTMLGFFGWRNRK